MDAGDEGREEQPRQSDHANEPRPSLSRPSIEIQRVTNDLTNKVGEAIDFGKDKLGFRKTDACLQFSFLVVFNVSLFIYFISTRTKVDRTAYRLGLVHALDIDHVSTIANLTRRQSLVGKNFVTYGLWFSIGHSTVVTTWAWIVCLTGDEEAENLASNMYALMNGTIGLIFSAAFLSFFSCFNLIEGIVQYRKYNASQRGRSRTQSILEGRFTDQIRQVQSCGTRIFEFFEKPHRTYIIGFIYGLGFDTATQVQAIHLETQTSTAEQIISPLMFTAGMSAVDTFLGCIMAWVWTEVFNNAQVPLFDIVVTFGTCGFGLIIITLSIVDHFTPATIFADDETRLWGDASSASGAILVVVYLLCYLLGKAINKRVAYYSTSDDSSGTGAIITNNILYKHSQDSLKPGADKEEAPISPSAPASSFTASTFGESGTHVKGVALTDL